MRHSSWYAVLFGAAFVCGARGATAQRGSQTVADSTPYLQAYEQANNGDPEEARETVDSLLKQSKEGTPAFAEGLYWRARLSAMGPAAERDYRRIVVDYASTPRAPEALLRLGQLELTRGDRDGAAVHFRRAAIEYPGAPVYAAANYWLARAYFEGNKLERACIANKEAMDHVNPSDIELKNQIEFQNQQCRGIALKVPGEDKAEPKSKKGKTAAHEKTEADTAIHAESDSDMVDSSEAMNKAGKKKAAPVNADSEFDPADETMPPVKPTKKKTDTAEKPATVAKSAAKTSAQPTKPVPAAKGSAATAGKFTVQVAAYHTHDQAADLVATLKQRGYTARIDGSKAPFRVRIGTFTHRADAEALLAKLRAKQIDGFVTIG